MNGNPHADDAKRLIHADNTWQGVGYETADAQHIVGHIEANTQATLALAYEQRTANLLHALEISLRAQGVMVTADIPAILARLGLNDGATA